MAYDIRLVKIVTGELIIGKFDAEALDRVFTDVAIMQTVPTQQGVQLMMLPYVIPSTRNSTAASTASIFSSNTRTLRRKCRDKYLEACSNLSLSSGGLNPNPQQNGGSGLIL